MFSIITASLKRAIYPYLCLYMYKIVRVFAKVLKLYTLKVAQIILIQKYLDLYADYF